MIPLPPRPDTDGAEWEDEILEGVRGEWNCEVTILDRASTGDSYDPLTGVGGDSAPIIVLGPVPARAQQVRAVISGILNADRDAGRHYIFEIEIRAGDPMIDEGMFLTVTGGRDPYLSAYTFQINSAIGGSHSALRTIHASTEESVAA